MKRSEILFAVWVGGMVLTAAATADDVADVKATAEDAVAAYNAGDVDAMASYWLPEATVFHGPGLPLEGFDKEQVKADLEAGLNYDFQWRDFAVKVYGQTALSTASLLGTVTFPNGAMIHGPWRHSATWVKQQGKWKVAHVHVSDLLPGVHAAQRLISRVHQAFRDGDLEAALGCYGESYINTTGKVESSSDDPTRWNAGFFTSRDDWRRVASEFFAPDNYAYTVDVEFLHTDVSETAAVVVTKETGSWTSGEGSNSWEEATNLWLLAKTPGGWEIVASMHHL